jgi:indole-3-glycerol phosphate synthase
LDVRRVAAAVTVPILFKEFVLDEIQIWLAKEMGAKMVLLLACALSTSELTKLVLETIDQGLAPVVEVANQSELTTALTTCTRIIGVNARDLSTFRVDPNAAKKLVERIPADRIAIYMSGVSSSQELKQIAKTRTDAVLIGSALMRTPSPGAKLKEILG